MGPLTSQERSELLGLIRELCYKRGDFTLASGKKSEHYVNGKMVLLQSRGAVLFARWLLADMAEQGFQAAAIGGLELGAVPVACSVMTLSEAPLNTFIVRKKAKAHGAGLAIEGKLEPGDSLVVVDDVITTGGSTWKAIETVEALGCKVAAIYCLVDRQDDTLPELAARGIRSFTTLSQLTAS